MVRLDCQSELCVLIDVISQYSDLHILHTYTAFVM